jgi:hypothetical protein
MAQFKDGDSRVINGITYVRTNGSWMPRPASPFGAPTLPYEGPQAAANLQRTQQEVQQAQATAAATTAKARADAQTAQIAAKQAEEQWNITHPSANGTEGLSGPAYMHYLQQTDPGRAAYVQGLAEGRVPFPNSNMMRTPAGQALLAQVMRADPTIDATNYTTRAAARVNAAKGTLGQSDNALITAVGHAARLGSLVPDVFGTPVQPLNSIANAIDSNVFGGKQPAYDQNAELLGNEVAAAYGANSQGKQNEAGAQFSSSLSSKQKNDNILGAIDLMGSKLAANRAQFAYGNGQLGKPDFMLLPPETRQEILSLPGGAQIFAKHFSGVPVMGANGGPGGGAPGAGPMGGEGGGPPPSPLGGTDTSVATGAYKTQYDPVTSTGLAALIRKGAPFEQAQAYSQAQGTGPLMYNGKPLTADDYAKIQDYAKANPGWEAVVANKSIPTTLMQRLSASAPAALIHGALSGATAGLSDTLGRAINGPQYTADQAALAALHPGMDLTGNIAGAAGSMIGGGALLSDALQAASKGGVGRNLLAWSLRNPVKANAIGDAGYGALYGANENPDNPATGAAVGAAGGMFGSMGGSALTRATGAVLNGVANPAVQRLRDAGIPLTVGEVLGGGAKKAQDALTSVFGPGNMVARRYADGRLALNQAAFDQAGQTIGAPINGVGQAGIGALNAAKNNAYSNALNPVSLNLNTPQTIDALGGALSAAKTIPNVDQASDLATGALTNYIGNAAPNGVMSGNDFQQAYRGLSRTANSASSRVYGHEIGQALGQGQDALVGALESQNPGAYQQFLNANSANRHLSILSDAVNAAKNQIGDAGEPLFTPAQLGTAASANARTYNGKVAAAAGDRPFNQLALDAQQVMSSKLPESGTFPRALLGTALLSGGGGMFGAQQNGYTGAGEGALLPLAALSLLGTRRGQQLLTSSLLNRTAADQLTGQLFQRNAQLGGHGLAAFSIPLLTSP